MDKAQFDVIKDRQSRNIASINDRIDSVTYHEYLQLVDKYKNEEDPHHVALIALFYIPPELINNALD